MIANDLKKGSTIIHDKQLWDVLDYQHVKPGKGGAFMKTKMKNLKTGSIVDVSFRAQEKIEEAFIDKETMSYSYVDGNMFYFMDEEYECIPIAPEILGSKKDFLKEEQSCIFWYHEKELIRIVLPETVVLKVTKSDPGVKGDTATNVTKPATLETGLTIQLPIFINEGDSVKVDTRTGKYVERVSTS